MFGIENRDLIKILNPLGEDLSVMRTSLVPSMVSVMAKNLNRKNLDGKFFEFARTYVLDKELVDDNLPIETDYLSIGAYGESVDFFTLKGVVKNYQKYFVVEKSLNIREVTNLSFIQLFQPIFSITVKKSAILVR